MALGGDEEPGEDAKLATNSAKPSTGHATSISVNNHFTPSPGGPSQVHQGDRKILALSPTYLGRTESVAGSGDDEIGVEGTSSHGDAMSATVELGHHTAGNGGQVSFITNNPTAISTRANASSRPAKGSFTGLRITCPGRNSSGNYSGKDSKTWPCMMSFKGKGGVEVVDVQQLDAQLTQPLARTYADDPAEEADIESMASMASMDSQEDDLDTLAGTDSEVASITSSTGGCSSICSDSSRGWGGGGGGGEVSSSAEELEEGEEDVALGISLARARMTAGKAPCSCMGAVCTCRRGGAHRGWHPLSFNIAAKANKKSTQLSEHEEASLLAEITKIGKGARGGSGGGARVKQGLAEVDVDCGDTNGEREVCEKGVRGGGGRGLPLEIVEEFTERFVRRDMALAGRVKVVEMLVNRLSVMTACDVLVYFGGFRVLYGWLGDAWESFKAHKSALSPPSDQCSTAGMGYVEELLGVLSRLPMSVDMLRETQDVARLAKKMRHFGKRHGLGSILAATERLHAHLHDIITQGVQQGVF
ncbi:unnamed protein product, partial [Choristocarpus tenellus]